VVRSDVQLTAPHKNWAKLTGINPARLLNRAPSLISNKLRPRRGGLELCKIRQRPYYGTGKFDCVGGSRSQPLC
jgi:hypothetical protein